MSATNRGAVRNEQDFYKTPHAAFFPLLPYLGACLCDFWEPACGDGRLADWMDKALIPADGDDLARGYDFLKDTKWRPGLVTNPPFSLAFEFCQHAVTHADHVFLLLRLNFLASGKRKSWFKEHEPDALFVLSDRPGFVWSCRCDRCKAGNTESRWSADIDKPKPKTCPRCGSGCIHVSSTDACDYAWYYWGKTHHGIHHL